MRSGYEFCKNAPLNLLAKVHHCYRMVIAEFPDANPNFLSYYVAEVTEEGSVMVIASHNTTYSNLYISDVVSEFEVLIEHWLEGCCLLLISVYTGCSERKDTQNPAQT